MTEEEAKTKWCPYAMVAAITKEFSCNRDHDGAIYQDNMCIASECMMWREIRTSSGYKFSEPDKDGRVTCLEGPEIVGGYCGLGGKP